MGRGSRRFSRLLASTFPDGVNGAIRKSVEVWSILVNVAQVWSTCGMTCVWKWIMRPMRPSSNAWALPTTGRTFASILPRGVWSLNGTLQLIGSFLLKTMPKFLPTLSWRFWSVRLILEIKAFNDENYKTTTTINNDGQFLFLKKTWKLTNLIKRFAKYHWQKANKILLHYWQRLKPSHSSRKSICPYKFSLAHFDDSKKYNESEVQHA